MSLFRNKNNGGIADNKVDENTVISATPPVDETETLWIDTSE